MSTESGSSDTSSTSTQSSVALARMASGTLRLLSAFTAASCWSSTNNSPLGSTRLAFWFNTIGTFTALMENCFTVVPEGHKLSGPLLPGAAGSVPDVCGSR